MANLALTDAINRINGTGATAAKAETAKANGQLGQQEFLKMLIAQLEHQDPLNPQDATQFTSQLATFSSLEQLIGIKSGVEKIGSSSGATDVLGRAGDLAALIDREVTAKGSQLAFDPADTTSAQFAFELPASVASGRVLVTGSTGNTIAEIPLDATQRAKGRHVLQWDGEDRNGATAAKGVYGFSVEAADSSGRKVAATTYQTGRVTGTSLEGDSPTLFLGSLVAPIEDVVEVRAARVAP